MSLEERAKAVAKNIEGKAQEIAFRGQHFSTTFGSLLHSAS